MRELIIRLLAAITILRRLLLHKKAINHLGIDASPSDAADDVLGCAESVTEIIKQVLPDFPVILGTWTLDDRFFKDRRFMITQTPQPGDIVISPTGTSKLGRKAPIRGHVGIIGENNIIMSNDSYTGKWMANYTIETWRKRYQDLGGYQVTFYTFNQTL